ncbi:hypothetical protein A2803_05505 [Candidatus Woesebacteria bacterium RIFCSPHIGHO2_01_FULL_44_21]|uniref:Uncharacterized protein n=1 Tax=Candidatus Woesebacteria bacterium RIFCSPHIGHO2_01_FULL_44_21 TaxID=1802503 RepID=A0A1F7YW05_9BACT|nr:MAG: hypothetical protein A2803_05505 [Candidatus Woesebacteria bacterium RIFCSPHIGHO2_01_FULL_44_21]OGM68777.1 MAG: hypothetical protein A2897_01240 [Candidatus Woesebacteria bacterium RIFCSPLOWO2_01_FULL_44_24b]
MSILSSKLKAIRKKREKEIKKRKNFFPFLIFTIILWFIFTLIIIFIDPEKKGALELFITSVFFANFFTFSLILGKARRGFFVAGGITFYIFLRYLGVGNLINLLLIIGVITAFEFYLSKRYN